MNSKAKKIINITVNVIVILIAIIVLFIAINSIMSKKKGYSAIFGTVSYAVKTDSMKGTNKDSFVRGDLVFVKELKTDDAKSSLKEGDVITFWDNSITGSPELNTHRISRVIPASEGITNDVFYRTKGDASIGEDAVSIRYDQVVGVYSYKIPLVGYFVLFIKSSIGFLLLIVIPSFLIFAYCIYAFVKNYKVYLNEKTALALEKSKETMRAELLKELENKTQDGTKEDIKKD